MSLIPEVTIPKKRRKNNDETSTPADASTDEMKKKTKQRKQQCPKFRLKSCGEEASLTTSKDQRVPLMLTDIQHLLLHSRLGNLNITQPPRWYTIDKCNRVSQTTALILEGLSIEHYERLKDKFDKSNMIFDDFVEVLTPSVYNGSLVQELALVPLSESEKGMIIKKYGSLNLALQARKDLNVMMRAVFPIKHNNNTDNNYTEDQFPRTQLILSAWQLVDENYPLPLKGKLQNAYSDYVLTKDEYSPVNAKSPMFGVDCEMCITNAGSELTRISIVNEKHQVVYESFVKPHNEITDYLTRFSGITKDILNDVTKRLEDVQKELRELLPPDAILVGQSLNVDLHALKMMHPYIIDTSLIYNFTGERTRKPKLKVLAKEFLKEDIQTGKSGHCSVEDSLASMKLVQHKLSKSLEYGDAVHTNRQKYKENFTEINTTKAYGLSIFNHMIEQKITSLVIGCDDITGDYHTYLTQAKESLTTQLKKNKNKKVKLNTVESVEDAITSLSEAVGCYNFVMAHLKLDVSSEDECGQVAAVDCWIDTVWRTVSPTALFVVIFGGSDSDNGLAMMKVKPL